MDLEHLQLLDSHQPAAPPRPGDVAVRLDLGRQSLDGPRNRADQPWSLRQPCRIQTTGTRCFLHGLGLILLLFAKLLRVSFGRGFGMEGEGAVAVVSLSTRRHHLTNRRGALVSTIKGGSNVVMVRPPLVVRHLVRSPHLVGHVSLGHLLPTIHP
uniref:Uncharacterized protein n=1 Tax=Triticum urartu TaxID=4572 RepID=A0A8R7P9E8_TRIUA